jgi:CspA family cold shock protein
VLLSFPFVQKYSSLILIGDIMQRGTVKWFNNKKGYGFIVTPEGKDLFVHFTQIRVDGYKTLKENQAVTYTVAEGSKGPEAHEVTPDISNN